MLKKYETLKRVNEEKIVAIVRVESEEKAEKTFDALIAGGIKVVELTFTIPYAHTILEKITKKYGNEVIIGAGSVLDTETARIAILSGATFIVSPTFSQDVSRLCNRYGIPYLCGVNTPTEILAAIESGVDVIKLFPASNFKPSVIKDIKGPLPNVEVMPTGGVGFDNILEWKKAGAFALGVGGELTKGAKTGDYALITETAKKFVEMIKQ